MTKNIIVSAVIALVVSVVAGLLFIGQSSQSKDTVRGLSERDIQAVSLKVGAKGTKTTGIFSGTCNAATTGLPLAATTTATFTCTATGVLSGDKVFVRLPSNPTAYGAFVAVAPVASTDTITFKIENLTGVATSSFPLATTSVTYFAVR